MQSISTRYLGPTDFRGSRVKAITSSGLSITISWDDALDLDGNHDAAAIALVRKLGWDNPERTHNREPGPFMYRGAAPGGRGNVYVFPCEDEKVCFDKKEGR